LRREVLVGWLVSAEHVLGGADYEARATLDLAIEHAQFHALGLGVGGGHGGQQCCGCSRDKQICHVGTSLQPSPTTGDAVSRFHPVRPRRWCDGVDGYFSEWISFIEVTVTARLTPVCAWTLSGCSVKERWKPPTKRLAP